MKKALCFVFDKNYSKQGSNAISSALVGNSDYDIILLTDITDEKLANTQITPKELGLSNDSWLLIGRIAIVEFALESLGYDTAIFVDADTYSYNSFYDLQEVTENHSMVVIPHITKPLPDDNYHPQNRTIAIAGNYNTGVWSASKKGLPFIKWWRNETELFPVTRPDIGLVAEQGWLRFANDFDDNTKIFKHPGYNVAYWNIKQRKLEKINNTWIIDDKPLCIIHFSGFKSDTPVSQMSIFQNRFSLSISDPVYELFDSYKKLIWG